MVTEILLTRYAPNINTHTERTPFSDVLEKFGWFAATFEWLATYILLWPADGRMKKEDIRAIYDVSDVSRCF